MTEIPEGGITFVIPQDWQYEQRQQGYLNIRPVEQSMVELSVRSALSDRIRPGVSGDVRTGVEGERLSVTLTRTA